MESLPALVCIAAITLLFVVPMWAWINVSEARARVEHQKAIEAGRTEPVTIQPYVDLSVCMGSGACVPACPEDVFKVIDGQAVAVNMAACIGHGACVAACPVGAIELVFGSEQRGIEIPRVGPDFQTDVPGVFIAGELGGMGLVANAFEQGTRAMQNAANGLTPREGWVDVAIVGAGPAGLAAAAAAVSKGMSYVLLDQEEIGGAVRHYPRKKLVFTRPIDIPGYGRVPLKTLHKEELVDLFRDVIARLGLVVDAFERVDAVRPVAGGFQVETIKRKVAAQRVILALGRRGTPRKLDVAGEDQEKVAYSLLEPEHFQNDHLMVVGGGDSAVEAALQLAEQPGTTVTLSYRGDKINRPKEKNIRRLEEAARAGQVNVMLESQITEIGKDRLTIRQRGAMFVVPNDHLFVLVGGVLPTRFLEATGVRIHRHFGRRVEATQDGSARETSERTERRARAPAPTAPLPPPPAQTVRLADLTVLLPTIPPAGSTASPRSSVESTAWMRSADDFELDDPQPMLGSPPIHDGESLLLRGHWREALAQLGLAAEAARELGDSERLGRALAGRGKALLELGRHDASRSSLREALRAWDAPPEARAEIRLSLGRIALQLGDGVGAEQQFADALRDARDAASRAAESHALIGLADCMAAQGYGADALDQLAEARALLGAHTEDLGSMLVRRMDLETVLGRYGDALRTGEQLLAFADGNTPLPEVRARALGILAEAFAVVGLSDDAESAVRELEELIPELGQGAVDPGIRAARALCAGGSPDHAGQLLDQIDAADESRLDDPIGQLLAVRARAAARRDPAAGRSLANEALGRPPPLYAARAAKIALDSALALHETGATGAARAAAKRGLKAVQGSGNKGLRLELLIAMYRASPDDRVVDATARTAAKILEGLPEKVARAFRAQPVIAEALAGRRFIS